MPEQLPDTNAERPLSQHLHPQLKPVELRLAHGDDAVRDALSRLLRALNPLNLCQEEAGTVELVLAEALNNIVEHAFPDADQLGMISISVMQRVNGLHVRIIDDGLPMPDGAAPLGLPQEVDLEVPDLPEGGFGWFLIRDLAKDVQYKRTAIGNQLDLRLAVALPQSH